MHPTSARRSLRAIRIAWANLSVLSCLIVACHRAVPVTSIPAKNIGPGPIVQDTGGVVAFFRDTGPVVNFPEARTFSLQTPGQRDDRQPIAPTNSGPVSRL